LNNAPNPDHAGPSGFTNCCGGVCNIQSETPCCHTDDGYIPCAADQVCAGEYSDVGLADYSICCAIPSFSHAKST
jgi:hypothetical protein